MALCQDIVFENFPESMVATISCRQMDYMIIDKLKRRIGSQAALAGKSSVILDLAGVEYMSSVVIGALVDMLRALQQRGHKIILTGLNKHVRAAFTITRMDRLFQISDSKRAALEATHPKGWK